MNLLDYIQGNRKGQDARRIEIESMREPFLADAIDGYDAVKGDHSARIGKMRGYVSARTRKNNRSLWITVVSSVAVMIFAFYFVVFNKSGRQPVEDAFFTIYVPADYLPDNEEISPTVEIINADMFVLQTVPVYVPAGYIEKKKMEITTEGGSGIQLSLRPETSVRIINLDEIFTPEIPIDIYVPDSYLSKEK